jgi:signal transduction histidine kinase
VESRKTPPPQPAPALEARARAIELLSDGFSHDARNPLNAVVIHLEVLSDKLRREQGAVPPSIEKNIRSIREQVNRLDELVRRFVELAAPRRQGQEIYDLSALLQSVVEQCTHHARLQRCNLRAQIAPQLKLAGLASELGVALTLLLVGQMDEGQKDLRLSAEQADGQVVLTLEGSPMMAGHPSLLELERLASALGGCTSAEGGRVTFRAPSPGSEPVLRASGTDGVGAQPGEAL